jgi:hypothetical protein
LLALPIYHLKFDENSKRRNEAGFRFLRGWQQSDQKVAHPTDNLLKHDHP